MGTKVTFCDRTFHERGTHAMRNIAWGDILFISGEVLNGIILLLALRDASERCPGFFLIFFADFIQPFGEDFLYGFLSTVSCPSIKFSLIWGNEGMLKRTFVREPHVYSMIMTNHGLRKRPWGALWIILRPPWQSANFLRKQIYNFLWIMLSEADN